MKLKLLALFLCINLLMSCWALTGKKITTINKETGEVTISYEPSPIESWAGILGLIVPSIAVPLGIAVRMVVKGNRAKNALMDANKYAIDSADWSRINTSESFKVLLKTAQAMHSDSKLIKKEYDKWKSKQ